MRRVETRPTVSCFPNPHNLCQTPIAPSPTCRHRNTRLHGTRRSKECSAYAGFYQQGMHKEFAVTQNIISLELSDGQIAIALEALTELEGALSGLISLDAEERRRLTKMGQKSEVFCRQALSVLAQNPQIVPPSLNLA